MPKQSSVPVHKPTETPSSPFAHMRDDLDRLFGDFMSLAPMRQRLFNLDRESGWPTLGWKEFHAADLVEKNGGYEIDIEVPGYAEKDIEVSLANGQLTVRGETKEEKEEEDKHYHLSERSHQSFQRSFTLPDGVDRDHIEAKLSKGLLIINIPKSKESLQKDKPQKIAVKAGKK